MHPAEYEVSGHFTDKVVEHRDLVLLLPIHFNRLMHFHPLDERRHDLIRQLRDLREALHQPYELLRSIGLFLFFVDCHLELFHPAPQGSLLTLVGGEHDGKTFRRKVAEDFALKELVDDLIDFPESLLSVGQFFLITAQVCLAAAAGLFLYSFHEVIFMFPHHAGYTLEIGEDGMVNGFRMRTHKTKLSTVRALQSIGFDTIAAGDSHNDLAMIRASKAGFLFKSTPQIIKDYPEFPAFEEYDELLAAIRAAL